MPPPEWMSPELTPEEEKHRLKRLISGEDEPSVQVMYRKTIEPFRFKYGIALFLFIAALVFCYFTELCAAKAYADRSADWEALSLFAVFLAAGCFWAMICLVADECDRELKHFFEVRRWRA